MQRSASPVSPRTQAASLRVFLLPKEGHVPDAPSDPPQRVLAISIEVKDERNANQAAGELIVPIADSCLPTVLHARRIRAKVRLLDAIEQTLRRRVYAYGRRSELATDIRFITLLFIAIVGAIGLSQAIVAAVRRDHLLLRLAWSTCFFLTCVPIACYGRRAYRAFLRSLEDLPYPTALFAYESWIAAINRDFTLNIQPHVTANQIYARLKHKKSYYQQQLALMKLTEGYLEALDVEQQAYFRHPFTLFGRGQPVRYQIVTYLFDDDAVIRALTRPLRPPMGTPPPPFSPEVTRSWRCALL